MVEQAVAAGEHQHVQIGLCQNVQADLHVVHAQANVIDQAFGLQAAQLGQGFCDDLFQHLGVTLAVAIGGAIVNVNHIQTGQPHALQAVLHAAANASSGVIPTLAKRQHVDVGVLVSGGAAVGLQQTPHLAGDHPRW